MESDPTKTSVAPSPIKENAQNGLTTASAEVHEDDGLTPEERAAKSQKWYIIGGIVFLLLLVGSVVLMATHPEGTTVFRDIAIVFVAVEMFVIGLAVIILIFQTQVLIQVLRDEIQPLLHSVNDTVSTVRGTTEFMSHNMVDPIIKASGVMAGVRRVVSDLFAVARASKPKKSNQSNQSQSGTKEA